MKPLLLASLFTALAVAEYPPDYIDFRGGGGGSAKGGDPRAPKGGAKSSGSGKTYTGGGAPAGAGQYKAIVHKDQPLAGHTIVSPASPPPAGTKWPGLIYHNNGCLAIGLVDVFNIVQNIASFGFYVVIDGNVDDGFQSGGSGPKFSGSTDGFDAIDWVVEQAGTGKLPSVDATKFGVAGTSCGGMQTYTTLQHSKAVAGAIISSGLFGGPQRAKLNQIKKPLGYFEGGSMDAGTNNGKQDYAILTSPATWASGPFGHGGGGAKMATAVATFFNWQLKGDETAKKAFLDPSDRTIKGLGYQELERKNWK